MEIAGFDRLGLPGRCAGDSVNVSSMVRREELDWVGTLVRQTVRSAGQCKGN
jgi:hypothetical protein